MNSLLLTLCICLAMLNIPATDVRHAAQKSSVTREIQPEYRSLLGTVDMLWARSDAVIQVTVGRLVKTGARETLVYSLYDLRIERVHKGPQDLRPGAVVQLRRQGGTVDFRDRVETHTIAGYPPFAEGERYVMFLRKSGQTADFGIYFYETTYGPDSVFAWRGENEDTPSRGQSALARQLSTRGALRDALERLRGGR